MRLIAWNANGVHHKKRSFEQNAKFLWKQHADLIIISETIGPDEPMKPGIGWTESKDHGLGLGVAVGDGLTLRAEETIKSTVLATAFQITAGSITLYLLAVWPVKDKGDSSYGKQLCSLLEDKAVKMFLGHKYAILAGDFNSTAKIKAQAKLHHKLVAQAKDLGLKSVFHEKKQANHGEEEEEDHTYRHGGRGKGHFHIDYCFLSTALLGEASFTILNGPKWEEHSDHFPIQVDFTVPGLSSGK